MLSSQRAGANLEESTVNPSFSPAQPADHNGVLVTATTDLRSQASSAPGPANRPPIRLRRGHPLGVVRSRQYRAYWLAGFSTFTGYNMQILTRGWMMQELTGSPFMVSLVVAAMMLPMLFLSLLGGVLADRMSRKAITIAADTSFVVTFSILTVVTAMGIVQPWHILLISALNGTAFALSVSARQALIAGLVHREQLRTAVGLSALTFNTGQIVGPALAGALLPTLGAEWSLAAGVVLVAPALYLYSTLRPAHQPVRSDQTGSVLDNLRVGVRHAYRDPTIRLLLTGALIMVFTVGPFQALMPVFAEDVLAVGAGGLSVLLLSAGFGALAGSLAVISIGERIPHEKVELFFGLLGTLSLAGFALSPWFPVSVLLIGLTGFAMTSFMVSNMTVLQVVTPDKLRGRVMSVRFLVIGMMPVGAAVAGGVAEATGAPAAVSVLALIGFGLFAFTQIAGRLKRTTAKGTHSD